MKIPATPPLLNVWLDNDQNTENRGEMLDRLFKLLPSDIGKDLGTEYLHWDKFRFKPLPEGIENHEEWWYLTKIRRSNNFRDLPFKSKNERPFVYWIPDPLQQRLHEVDQQTSGRVQIAQEVANPGTRDRYLVSSLIEEAITSSQLEGASTTHKVARDMLREQRKPRDVSEQMIFNNYNAMSFIREVANEPLTKNLLLELHKIVTEGTLGDSRMEGTLRTKDDSVAVYDERDNSLLHDPPQAEELDERLSRLCKFANQSKKGGHFIHPVVKAIVLHFMIGYDHPFNDGNGRTARALFYWAMAKYGYWMMEFISISTIIRKGPVKYARAYLHTETDDNDLTYFIDYNLRIVLQAVRNLQDYLARKAAEVEQVEHILGSTPVSTRLNHRQLALLSHVLRNPNQVYTIESHRQSHNVSYPTARSDLLDLSELELLQHQKTGNRFVFIPVGEIETKLKHL